MSLFGSDWVNNRMEEYEGGILSGHWKDEEYIYGDLDHPRENKSVNEILDSIDIQLIEKYLRRKKLQKMMADERKK